LTAHISTGIATKRSFPIIFFSYSRVQPASPLTTDFLDAAYAEFWQWFTEYQVAFFQAVREQHSQEDFFPALSPALDRIKEGFYFQAGMADEHTAELEISAEGALENIVFVEELIRAAPALAGWKFTALKQPTDIENIVIQMGGYEFGADTLRFYPTQDPAYPDEIVLTVTHPDLTEENRSTIGNGVFIFLDNCLGELVLATTVDYVQIESNQDAPQALIPIERLRSYVTWRQAEFVERYEVVEHNTDNDTYASFTAEHEDGQPLVAVMNTDLLAWQAKASHPWVLVVTITYDGSQHNGMPDKSTYALLDEVEDQLVVALPEEAGYLNIGRQTTAGNREIYFACREFRQPAKVLYFYQQQVADTLEMTYSLSLDKYWRTFERFGS
jgi:hypothetical protein